MTVGKNNVELTALANEALHEQPGCETAHIRSIGARHGAGAGRNWEIPQVVLGDSLISDVDRAVISIHRRLGRQFHLVD